MFLLLTVLAVVLLGIYFKVKYSYWSSRGIKGPRPWPFVGTLIEENFTLDGRAIEEKYLKEYGQVFGTYVGTCPVFNTSKPEHIKQILTDIDTFWSIGSFEINDDYIKNSIVSFFVQTFHYLLNYKFKNRSFRMAQLGSQSVMSHHFTSGNLKSLFSHFKGVTDNVVKNIDQHNKDTDNASLEIKPLMRCFGIDMLSKFVFSIDIDSYAEKDSELKKQIMNIGQVNPISSFIQSFLPKSISRFFKVNGINPEPANVLGRLFKKTLRQRKDNGVKYKDLSQLMQSAIDEKKVDMDENTMIGNAMLAYFAGIETVSNSMCRILQFLTENPEVRKRLYKELKRDLGDNEFNYETLTQHAYLDAVVNESLRLGTAIFIQERTAMKDCYIGEYKIDKGTEIYIIPYISHTSPDNYPDPKKFDPERFMDKSSSNENKINAGTFLPFSQGNKACLGKLLATIEIKYLLARILLNYDLPSTDLQIETECVRGFEFVKKMNVIFERR